MAFTLNIKTANAAFGEGDDRDYETAAEVARILRDIAAKISDADGHLPAGGNAMDYNGNTVGRWELTR